MRRVSAALAAATCLAALPAAIPARAQQAGTTEPETVVTATRVPTPVQDIPAGVTVITRQQIEQNDDLTLVQALQDVPGLRVAQSGGPGGNASVFIRGTDSNQVLVLLDGFPINDASDAGGAYNFGVDSLADVERIEIIRGPMASLYGSGAIGGVINIITRRGTQPGVHLSADESAGYPAQLNSSEALSGTTGAFDYAAVAQVQSMAGYDSTPQRESIYSGTPQEYHNQLAYLNLGYTPVPGTRASIILRARRTVFGYDALGNPNFDYSNSLGHDTSLFGRASLTSALFGGALQTAFAIGRLQDDRQYTETLNPADPNLATNDSRYHSYRTDLQWNNTVHLADLMDAHPLSLLDLTFGYERTADTAKVNVQSSTDGYPYAEATSASMTDDALHAGIQAQLSRLTLTAQIRQDWVVNDSPTTWRAGAVFDIPEIRTHLKGSYGTAFLAPSLFDRYGVDSTGYIGNPNLLPETAEGWEIGFTSDAGAFGRHQFASFGATYFNEQITNLIEEVYGLTSSTSENIGSAHIQGAELVLTLTPTNWLAIDASYTYTYPIDADTNERLLRRPQSTASADARITPIPRLTLAPQVQFTGAFQDYLVDNAGYSTGAIGTSNQGVIVNFTATYRINPRFTVYASGKNLFNSRFEPVNGYETPGATGIAGVRISLGL